MLIKHSGKYVKIYFNMKITFVSATHYYVLEHKDYVKDSSQSFKAFHHVHFILYNTTARLEVTCLFWYIALKEEHSCMQIELS